jgi:cell division cycle 20-like protein 1 (cofactor of APC complex)
VSSSKTFKLLSLDENELVCSLSHQPRAGLVGVGNLAGCVNIFDPVKQALVTQTNQHEGRVGSLAWNGWLIASGSRDYSV